MRHLLPLVALLLSSAGLAAPTLDDPLRTAVKALLDEHPQFDAGPVRRFLELAPPDQGYQGLGQAAVYAAEEGVPDELKALAAQATQDLAEFEDLTLLLADLDVELPARLPIGHYQKLRQRHAALKEALDTCQEDPRPGRCGDENQAYTNALLADPLVLRPYFLLVAARMALFPRDALARRSVMVRTPLLLVIKERLECLAKGVDPCPFRGLDSINAQVEKNVRESIQANRQSVEESENDWPTDPATLAWIEAQERDFELRVTRQGAADIAQHCGDLYRKRFNWESVRELYDCQASVGSKILSANPAYMDPKRLLTTYETLKTSRVERLAQVRARKFGRRMGLLGTAIAILAVLGALWSLAKRFGGKAALSISLAIVAIGGALAATTTVRYGIEAAFEADTGARVNEAVFSVLMSEDLRQIVSRRTEDGLNLVAGPLFAISPVVEEKAREALEVPLLGHLLASWARDAAPLAERRVLDAARPTPGQPLPDPAEVKAKGESTFATIKGHAAKLAWIGLGWVALQGLLGVLPLLLMVIVVWLFVKPLGAQLVELAKDARGDGQTARLGAFLSAELRSLLLFLPALVLLLIVIGELLSTTLGPIVRLLVRNGLRSVLHLTSTQGAPSGTAVLLGLGALIVLLALTVVVYLWAFGTFTGKWREIVRERFHGGRSFAEQRWFFTRGLGGLLWVFAFPVVMAVGLLLVVQAVDPAGKAWDEATVTAGDLMLWPMIGLGAFVVLAWATRIFAILGAVKRFSAAGEPTA